MYPNWFKATEAISNFEQLLTGLNSKKINCLQIGVYTGDATEWMANNILGHKDSKLWDVDTWLGSEEPVHKNMDFNDVYKIYTSKNKSFIGDKVIPFVGTSDAFFINKPKDLLFDFIYIDGDHTAFQVMKDGINSYLNLKPGGILAFDDYTWSLGQGALLDPAPAINWLLDILNNEVKIIAKSGQVWIKKI